MQQQTFHRKLHPCTLFTCRSRSFSFLEVRLLAEIDSRTLTRHFQSKYVFSRGMQLLFPLLCLYSIFLLRLGSLLCCRLSKYSPISGFFIFEQLSSLFVCCLFRLLLIETTRTPIDVLHPLYLHPSDTHITSLVPEVLTGSKNYVVWSRAMRLAFQDKKKIGFIDSTFTHTRTCF